MYKVLIADDEAGERTRVRQFIEHSGYPVQVVGEAEHGIAALQAVREYKQDLLIADIKMPGMDGLELAQKMMELGIETYVILISGYAEYEYARSAMRYGVNSCLLKPVKQQPFYEALETFLREKMQEKKIISVQEQPQPNPLKQLFDEIQESYMDDITLHGLAEKYNISSSRLSIQVKEKFGMSFSKYLTYQRIEKAKEMLREDGYSIEQIAEMVGYRDYFYFAKVFKRITGVSPSSYRKNLEM